jgi:hypothetical protein
MIGLARSPAGRYDAVSTAHTLRFSGVQNACELGAQVEGHADVLTRFLRVCCRGQPDLRKIWAGSCERS